MTQEIEKLETKAKDLSVQIKALGPEIKDQEMLKQVNQAKLALRDLRNEIKSVFEPMKKKAYAAYKEILEQWKKIEAPVVEAEKYCDKLLAAWFAEQRRQREEAERKRLEAIRKQREEEERKLREALKAEEEGRKSDAERLLEEAIEKKPAVIPPKPKPQKLEGVYSRIDYDFEIIDESKIPREYLRPDETKIRRAIREAKGEIEIPGIKVIKREIISVRR